MNTQTEPTSYRRAFLEIVHFTIASKVVYEVLSEAISYTITN